VDSRLELAKSLGATHTINSRDRAVNLAEQMKSLTDGEGTTITVETTGNLKVLASGLEGTAIRGQLIVVGVPPLGANLEVDPRGLIAVWRALHTPWLN
jgi:Zn-dependent alcohol dehydrogenase